MSPKQLAPGLKNPHGHHYIFGFKAFKIQNSKDLNYDPAELWKHSLGVAVAFSTIAELTGLGSRQRAYSCGLVHDIGKVARLHLHPEDLQRCRRSLYQETGMIDGASGNSLLTTFLVRSLQRVGLNKDVESVIRWHHEPEVKNREDLDDDELNNLVDIVMVGNWLGH